MYTFFVILIVITSILMCLVVLIQESKGGGLAADYASGNTLLGAPKTTNIIQVITRWLAGIMIALSIISTYFLPDANAVDSVLQLEQPAAAVPALPTIPATEATSAPAPATTTTTTEAPAAN